MTDYSFKGGTSNRSGLPEEPTPLVERAKQRENALRNGGGLWRLDDAKLFRELADRIEDLTLALAVVDPNNAELQ